MVDDGLTPGQHYRYSICAVDRAGNVSTEAGIEAYTLSAPAPDEIDVIKGIVAGLGGGNGGGNGKGIADLLDQLKKAIEAGDERKIAELLRALRKQIALLSAKAQGLLAALLASVTTGVVTPTGGWNGTLFTQLGITTLLNVQIDHQKGDDFIRVEFAGNWTRYDLSARNWFEFRGKLLTVEAYDDKEPYSLDFPDGSGNIAHKAFGHGKLIVAQLDPNSDWRFSQIVRQSETRVTRGATCNSWRLNPVPLVDGAPWQPFPAAGSPVIVDSIDLGGLGVYFDAPSWQYGTDHTVGTNNFRLLVDDMTEDQRKFGWFLRVGHKGHNPSSDSVEAVVDWEYQMNQKIVGTCLDSNNKADVASHHVEIRVGEQLTPADKLDGDLKTAAKNGTVQSHLPVVPVGP